MVFLTRRTGDSTHPGPTYSSSDHPVDPTHLADPYPAHSSDSTHTYLHPTHSAHRDHPIHPINSIQPASLSYDLSSSSVDIQQVHQFANSSVTPASSQPIRHAITFPHELLEPPVRAELASTTLRTPQFTVGDLYVKKWWRTTIEVLPEDILLDIFDFYRLDAMERPWKWHRLAHVCRIWRLLITISSRRLDLRILCEYGAPFGDILQSWPTLPLVVWYNDSKSSSLSKDIVVALRRPDRVCEIDLAFSNSLIGSIVPVIQKQFPALERIRNTVENATGPPWLFGGTFLGGSASRLEEIHLDGVAFPFPTIRQVLSSSANNLVRLWLSNIPNCVYFSPLDLVNALSTLIHLKSLTIGFHSPASRPPPPPPSSTMTRRRRATKRTITLSSLTDLYFHGAHEYLEEFISQIDLPSLFNITIELFNQIVFEMPHFCRFIPHVRTFGSPNWVFITHSAELVNVTFVQPYKPLNEKCFLGTSCQRLDWQLSFTTQLTTQLSPFILSNVQSLITDDARGSDMPTGVEDVDSAQWLEFFRPFRHVTRVYVWRKLLVPGIVQALVMGAEEEADENVVAAGVFPGLNLLFLGGYRDSPSVVKDAEQFVSARRLAGRTVRLDG
jgi:hypothetical protein